MKKMILTLSMLTIATFAFSQQAVKARVVNTQDVALITLPKANLLRIEQDVSASWKGVTGCCQDNTPEKQVNKQFEKWVKDQLFKHRDKKFVSYGHGGGNAKCRSGKEGFPSNKRYCRGSATVKAYIEFARN